MNPVNIFNIKYNNERYIPTLIQINHIVNQSGTYSEEVWYDIHDAITFHITTQTL
jgi:hypothetical protein